MMISICIVLLCLAMSVRSCDLVLSDLRISQVFTFSVDRSQFKLDTFKVCLRVSTFEGDQSYIARLDYLPNVGLDAKNDSPMYIEDRQLTTQIQITKRSEPLNMDKYSSYSYRFVVEIRKADIITIGTKRMLTYEYFLNQYIWVLFFLSIISWFTQRHLFGKTQEKTRND